ncbi:MAG: replication restart helicase PriA [Francisellaceae bacterium]
MIIRVLVPGPFQQGLDYIYDHLDNPLHCRVEVPLGRRQLIGFVIAVELVSDQPLSKLRHIIRRIDAFPVFSHPLIKLLKWMANYYHASFYSLLKLAVPKLLLQHVDSKGSQINYYRLKTTTGLPPRMGVRQKQIISLLTQHDELSDTALRDHDITQAALKRLIELDVVECIAKSRVPEICFDKADKALMLNKQQRHAVDEISRHVGHFYSFLLFGITGSGKTEVYLQSIAPLIEAGKQVLILVPEINLTPQTLSRFERRFDVPVIAVHSKLSDQQRLDYWCFCKNNLAKIIISTRSGLFLDFADLGMIIVDEEHDASFKQHSNVYYHGRDVAIYKAYETDVPVVLGSATPSIESYYHTSTGKYAFLQLEHKAKAGGLSPIHIIDMKNEKVDCGLSETLKVKMDEVLARNEQVLLFINRRGFAHALFCADCGWCAHCDSCDKPYTLHLKPQHLACHFCDKTRQVFLSCPHCHSANLKDYGFGTEKIEQYLDVLYPNFAIVRLDRGAVSRKHALQAKLDDIKHKRAQIIIGTQMVAKGHDFSDVTLVGIINGDSGFYSQDFHSVERTAQLITQVAGRAGRAEKSGNIYLQSYQPENPILQDIIQQDYQAFLEKLLLRRQLLNYPPFRYQAYIYAVGFKLDHCIARLRQIQLALKETQLEINGPMPAIFLKQAAKYRAVLMLSSMTRKALHQAICLLDFRQGDYKDVRLSLDIDPIEIK